MWATLEYTPYVEVCAMDMDITENWPHKCHRRLCPSG